MSTTPEEGLKSRSYTLTNVFAQLSLVLAVPIITRYLDAEQFGHYQVVLALATILQAALTGGIEYLIPAVPSAHLPRTLRRAITILIAGAVLVAGFGIFAIAFGSQGLGVTTLAALSIATVYAIAALDTAWRGRFGMLTYLARRNAIFGCLVVSMQVLACLLWPTLWALVVAVILARIVSVLATRRRPTTGTRTSVDQEGSQSSGSPISISQNIGWVVGVVLSNVALQLPVLIIGVSSLQVAGQVGLAIRLVGLPSAIIGAAVGQTFSFRFARLLREDVPVDRATAFVRSTQLRWGLLGISAAIIGVVLAPHLVGPLFGPGWELVGTYIAILAIPFGMQMVSRIVTPAFATVQCTWSLANLQLIRISVVVVALLAPTWWSSDPTGPVVALAVGSGLYFLGFALVTERTVRQAWPHYEPVQPVGALAARAEQEQLDREVAASDPEWKGP